MTRAELAAFLEPAFAALREQVVDLVYADVTTRVDEARELALAMVMKAFRQGGETVAAPGIAPGVRARAAKVSGTRAASRSRRAGSTPAPDTSTSPAPDDARAHQGPAVSDASTAIAAVHPKAPATSILSAIPKTSPAPSSRLSPAELEAAKQRIAAKRAAAARRDAPPQHVPPPDEEPPVLPMPENPTLPTPRSSWSIDGDYVRPLGESLTKRAGRPRLSPEQHRERCERDRERKRKNRAAPVVSSDADASPTP